MPWYWLPSPAPGRRPDAGAATPARRTSGERSDSRWGSRSRLDIAKGSVAAVLGLWLGSDLVGVLAGVAAMVGHWRPLFLGFARGGKIVATTAAWPSRLRRLPRSPRPGSGSFSSSPSATPRCRRWRRPSRSALRVALRRVVAGARVHGRGGARDHPPPPQQHPSPSRRRGAQDGPPPEARRVECRRRPLEPITECYLEGLDGAEPVAELGVGGRVAAVRELGAQLAHCPSARRARRGCGSSRS